METKRVTVDFANRSQISFSGESIKSQMDAIETNFQACNDILSSAGMDGINYEFQAQEISTVAEMLPILTAYVASVPLQVESELDKPLTEDFQNKVIPVLTDIVIKDIKTQRTSIETHGDVDGNIDIENAQVVVREIGFESFLNVTLGMSVEDMQSPENVRAVDIFINLFREEFESQVKGGRSLDENIYYYLDYIPQWKYIASDIGDVIFVKPLVECIVGVDLITGEELNEHERCLKFVTVLVDLSGIGGAAKMGASLGTKGVVEIVMVSTATNAVSTMNSDLTQMFVKDMGGSDGTAMVAGIISGLTTSYTSNRIMGNAFFNTVTEVNGINGGVIDDVADDVIKGSSTEAFDYYMDLVEQLDVSTKPNTATFYSGPGNRALAEEFANINGKMTLETTPGGAYLDSLGLFKESSPLTKEEATNVWARLSARYAQGASGNTYGFVNGSWSESIFNTVEYPELLNNPNVTNIFTEFMN